MADDKKTELTSAPLKVAIRYYSRGGNTKKIAEAIAGALGVEAMPISEPISEAIDVLFLGNAPYAFDLADEVKAFVAGLGVRVGKIVNFGTSAAIGSTRKYLTKALAEKKIPLAEEEFFCRGSFLFLHKGRPNEKDCAAAAAFARRVLPNGGTEPA